MRRRGTLDAKTDTKSRTPEESEASSSNGQSGDEPADDSEGEQASGPDRTTVRITRSIGEIFGVDEREYVLEAEDVVALPTANAEPLVARDAAEKLE